MVQRRSKLTYASLTTIGVLLLVAFAVGSVFADRPDTVTQFEAVSVACPQGEVLVTDEPLPLFKGTAIVNATITDKGEIFVDAVNFPTAYPGSSWIAPGQGRFTPTGFFVNHHGYGTGDLEGGKIQYRAIPLDEPVELPCEPVGPVVKLTGVIIVPPGLVDPDTP